MARRSTRRTTVRVARIIRFPLVRVSVRPREPDTMRCAKCGSAFVEREPAFIHCRYCGCLTRIPEASLLEQELFEIRSGLRLAS